jgi:predicted membrane metal-binding protein
MKFFLIISLLSALFLSLRGPVRSEKPGTIAKQKAYLASLPLKQGLIGTFGNMQNGRVFWAFLTGDKKEVSPKIKADFNSVELGFLFSPSGLHLAAIFLFFFFILRKMTSKKISRRTGYIAYLLFYFFPSFAIKRIILLKGMMFLKHRLKKRWSLERLFLLTFFLSFLLGHYFQSPLGFAMSFLYMGTFIALRNHSRWKLLIGLFCSHLLIAFFCRGEVSLLSLLFNIPLITFFSAMMSLSGFYLLSYKWMHANWIEKFVEIFLWLIKKSALLSHGTHMNPSFFLLAGLWAILFKADKKWIALCFLLHTGLANSPSCFVSGSLTQSPSRSADKSLYYSAR